jgi:hypothetical protein
MRGMLKPCLELFCTDAFSSRKPESTSLENALGLARICLQPRDYVMSIPVGWENRIESMLDQPVMRDNRDAL